MKILLLNGSPKGKNSITLQTALYLQAIHPEHTFDILHVGQKLRSLEKDFTPAREALSQAELLLFVYPVYTFIAPYQIHRFIELVKESGVDLRGKYASQITTSKHFYDVTAHRYVEENCFDLGLKVIRGLSADMDDLLTDQGQKDAKMFFQQLIFSREHDLVMTPLPKASHGDRLAYAAQLQETPKTLDKDVVIITSCGEEDAALSAMIDDFRAALPCKSRVVNLRRFPFTGGCLGCFGCAITGKCVHKDGFDEFLRKEIQTADAMVYAFAIENHYAHSCFKCFDDRQFCNGHRTVTHGTPVAYLMRGDYAYENNLRMIVEGRAEVGGNYLAGVATDEGDIAADIQKLAANLVFAMEQKLTRPANFYGVGGMKIFRDLIYVMQGFMKADHKFYKEHGIYDFPQKQWKRIWLMRLVGLMMMSPKVQQQMKGQMNQIITGPYEKLIAKTKEESGQNQNA